MKIGLYISDILFRVGGTEANTAYIIYALQNFYSYPEITIVSEKYNHPSDPERQDVLPSNKSKTYSDMNIHEHFNSHFGTHIKPDNMHLLLIYAKKNNFFNRASFERKLYQTSKQFDIFINCTMNLYSFSAKKNIAIVHFPPYKKIHSNFVKKFPFFFFSALYKDFKWFSSYDLYITYSKYTQMWLDKLWHINDKRSALINPAVSFVRPSDVNKQNIIMICSRIEPSKEIDLLLNIFLSSNILKQFMKLYIVGAAINEHSSYINKIKEIIKDQSDIIKIIENPNREEIEKYYNLSKIFWHAKGYSHDEDLEPAELEHFGITTVEAMSAGCVPVVINKGGQKEIINDGINGFLWDNPEQLIEKTVFLLQNQDKRIAMSKAAKESAKRYSVDEFAKNLDKILKSKL
jgi:glycosyltransferase involved in cell wall biosynthesis